VASGDCGRCSDVGERANLRDEAFAGHRLPYRTLCQWTVGANLRPEPHAIVRHEADTKYRLSDRALRGWSVGTDL
jgi:hypothetical protein